MLARLGNTLVQHVCRNMSDTESHEAVMNKSWYRQVADQEATHLQQKMSPSRRLSMTIPAWASKKLQGEAALWSTRRDNGTGQAIHHSAPRLLKRRLSILCMRCSSLPCRTLRLSWLMRRRRRNKLLPRACSRCHGTCLRQIAIHLRPTKHCARKMTRNTHGWSRSARLRRTLKATGRVAMETSTDRAFVRRSLHSFASRVLEGSSFSPSHVKRMHAFMLPCVEVEPFFHP